MSDLRRRHTRPSAVCRERWVRARAKARHRELRGQRGGAWAVRGDRAHLPSALQSKILVTVHVERPMITQEHRRAATPATGRIEPQPPPAAATLTQVPMSSIAVSVSTWTERQRASSSRAGGGGAHAVVAEESREDIRTEEDVVAARRKEAPPQTARAAGGVPSSHTRGPTQRPFECTVDAQTQTNCSNV